ncbi:MAG: hypothetical protein IJF90_13065, partial [Synergistaceae bacterium]|nr:hypothetical protein [Synergistaceae bacterium]
NTYGQLGIGTNDTILEQTPQRLTFFDNLDEGEYVTKVYAGQYHSVAVTSKGSVYTWGRNDRGQLGLNYNPSLHSMITAPEQVTVAAADGSRKPLTGIVKASTGSNHTVVLTAGGILYAWGWNEYGQLGNDSDAVKSMAIEPVIVKNINNVVDLSRGSGGQTSYAIRYDGTVWGWGNNEAGQINFVSKTDNPKYIRPTRVDLTVKETTPAATLSDPDIITVTNYNGKVIRVYGGLEYSAALLNDGTAITWGKNDNKELGRDVTSKVDVNGVFAPDVIDVSNTDGGHDYIIDLAAGTVHAIAMLDDQRVLGWGSAQNGRLGDWTNLSGDHWIDIPEYINVADVTGNTSTAGATPTTVTDHIRALTIGTGGAFTVIGRSTMPATASSTDDEKALAAKNGLVYTFGLNSNGQLGLGAAGVERDLEQHITGTVVSVAKPSIVAGGMASLIPTSKIMPVTTTETVKISIPRFYITGDEDSSADYGYYILNTVGTNVITFTKNTKSVYANNQGIAVLVIEDFENGTNMKATFQVIDENERRTTGLLYILEHDPEALKFIGEERDTQWFFERSFLTADDYELITVTDINKPVYEADGVTPKLDASNNPVY